MARMRSATMDDVAREAGVSRALVSMALRNVPGVNDQTRLRILEVADRMGYRVNRIASSLASRSPDTFGVFLLDLRQDIYADMYDGIRQVTDVKNQHTVLAVGESDGSRDGSALETLVQSRVGVILAAGLLMPDTQVQMHSRNIPIISVSRQIPDVDNVYLEDFLGAVQATEYLLSLGHKRILFLSNPQTDGYKGRHDGYSQAMKSAGLPPNIIASTYSRQSATADIKPILDLNRDIRPTAVFAHNDTAALGVLDAAYGSGFRVPDDISVLGFDNSLISRAPGTGLSTVDIHGAKLGAMAAEMAQRRLANPDLPTMQEAVMPTLVVRNTTSSISL